MESARADDYLIYVGSAGLTLYRICAVDDYVGIRGIHYLRCESELLGTLAMPGEPGQVVTLFLPHSRFRATHPFEVLAFV